MSKSLMHFLLCVQKWNFVKLYQLISSNKCDWRKQKFKLEIKEVEETRNFFIKETKQNGLMKNKKNVCTSLKYIEQSLILFSAITGCCLISALILLFSIPIGTASSAEELKICGKAAVIKE